MYKCLLLFVRAKLQECARHSNGDESVLHCNCVSWCFSHEVLSGESSKTKGLFLTSQVYLNIYSCLWSKQKRVCAVTVMFSCMCWKNDKNLYHQNGVLLFNMNKSLCMVNYFINKSRLYIFCAFFIWKLDSLISAQLWSLQKESVSVSVCCEKLHVQPLFKYTLLPEPKPQSPRI